VTFIESRKDGRDFLALDSVDTECIGVWLEEFLAS
jgi:hypothetical protein